MSPFPEAVRDGGKWTILIMVNILFLCKACYIYIYINPHSPSSFLQKAIPEWVALWIFFSEELLFSVQSFISNSYAKRGQEMRHFSRYS